MNDRRINSRETGKPIGSEESRAEANWRSRDLGKKENEMAAGSEFVLGRPSDHGNVKSTDSEM
jgi:hypothetical protein